MQQIVHIREESILIKSIFRQINKLCARFSIIVRNTSGRGKPPCIAPHSLQNGNIHWHSSDFHPEISRIVCYKSCGTSISRAMICERKIVVDGFWNADHGEVVPAGLGQLSNLVAGVHRVVAAVVEEAADVVLFRDFENTGMVGIS